MAEVSIEVGGRRYDVACRDGEEPQLRRLAMLVDQKAEQARSAVGSNANEDWEEDPTSNLGPSDLR